MEVYEPVRTDLAVRDFQTRPVPDTLFKHCEAWLIDTRLERPDNRSIFG